MVKALIPWGLLFGLFFIINPFPSFLPAYNEFKFIGLPLLGIFLWSYYRPSLKTIDIFLLAFVLFVCVSLIDAKVISLSWQPMFNWISIVFLTIGLRPLLQQYQKEIFELFHAAFGLMVLLIGIGIYLKIPSTINQNWVDFAGQNINYCTVMPIIFGTTFIFYPHKSLWWLIPKLISLGVLLHFVDYFRSGLGLVLLAFIIPIFVLKILPPKLRWVFVGLGIVVGIFFLPKDWIDVFWAKLDEYASGKDIRVYNSMISWIAFKEHWYNGMGAGNWILSVFEYIPDMEIPYESFNFGLFHKRSHEFLFRLGSEIGVFGFLCFIVPFFWVVVKTLKSAKILDSILLAPLMTITVIFSCFFTFEIVESNEQTYNESLQMLFLMFGFLTLEFKEISIRPIFRILVFILFFVASVWYSFWFYANHNFLRSILREKEGNIEQSIIHLEKIYHPVFRSVVGAESEPVDWLLAQKYIKLENFDKALFHLEKAYALAPYHGEIGVDYARILLKTDKEKAKEIAQKVKDHHLGCRPCDYILTQ